MATGLQRPLRGSRISSFYPVKTLPSLASLDSAFQLQEYISLLIRLDVHDVDAIVSVPGKNNGKDKDAPGDNIEGGEEGKLEEKDAEKERKTVIDVDEACWIYEQLRRLAQDLSHPLITMLQQECTRASCPEMKAGEWLYLCVAHGTDGAMEQCCAIDYILHTLDSATALLNSPRAFPSRLQIPQTSHRHFTSLARRLGRIFAHAYFHHREAFEQAEAESSLYARFLALTSKFDLVPPEFLVIPPRLTLSEGSDRGEHRRDVDVQPPRLLAAAVDPQGERNRDRQREQGEDVSEASRDDWDQGSGGASRSGNERSKSKSPPGLGSESPRKFGRNRTDTMVFSEAINVVEELAKSEDEANTGSSRVTGRETFSILERKPEVDVSSPEEASDVSSSLPPAEQKPDVSEPANEIATKTPLDSTSVETETSPLPIDTMPSQPESPIPDSTGDQEHLLVTPLPPTVVPISPDEPTQQPEGQDKDTPMDEVEHQDVAIEQTPEQPEEPPVREEGPSVEIVIESGAEGDPAPASAEPVTPDEDASSETTEPPLTATESTDVAEIESDITHPVTPAIEEELTSASQPAPPPSSAESPEGDAHLELDPETVSESKSDVPPSVVEENPSPVPEAPSEPTSKPDVQDEPKPEEPAIEDLSTPDNGDDDEEKSS